MLAFTTAPDCQVLNLARPINSLDHSSTGTQLHISYCYDIVLLQLVDVRFQVLFHSPLGVLFAFPSRYWFAIGHRLVFSLGGWAPRIRTGFHVSRPTWDPTRAARGFGYGALTLSRRPFQAVPLPRGDPTSWSRNPGEQAPRFGLLRVRSPLLAQSLLFSSPAGTEMFHFPASRFGGLFIHPPMTASSADGLLHSEILGSKRVCRSPGLIAAYRVLRRLAMPRHPPCALSRLCVIFPGFRPDPDRGCRFAATSLRLAALRFEATRSVRLS